MIKQKILLSASFIVLSLYFAGEANAQEYNEERSENSNRESNRATSAPGDIVVTAQKRTSTVNTTPLAITAVDPSQLQSAGVTSLPQMSAVVPGLQINVAGDNNWANFVLRGVSTLTYDAASNAAVSTYTDGIYVDLPVGFASNLYDVDRIEVLRGPQGTLYGRSATGGSVNVFTGTPVDHFDANADVSYGRYDDVQAHAMINVPVAQDLSIRAAGMIHRNNGYIDTMGTTGRNYGAADERGARLTALWKPGSRFTWRLSGEYYESTGTPGVLLRSDSDGNVYNGGSPYRQKFQNNPSPAMLIRSNAIRSRMDWEATDDLTISYVGGYQAIQSSTSWATSGQVGAPSATDFQFQRRYRSNSTFHEIDASLETGILKNVFGGSFFDETIPQGGTVGLFANFGIISTSLPSSGIHKRSWGIFDQADLAITDKLTLTGGIRYSHDFQDSGARSTVSCTASTYPNIVVTDLWAFTAATPGCRGATVPYASASFSNIGWKAGLQYQLAPETLTYLQASTGYKPGGVQPGLPVEIPASFNSEKVVNYEFGVKTRLFDNALNLRTAIFYSDYSNLQVFQPLTLASGQVQLATINAASATLYGIEIEAEANLTPVDHFRGYFTYTHATYDSFPNAIDPRTNKNIGSLDGNSLPAAPRVTFRVQYSHDFELANGGRITPTAALYFQSKQYLDILNISDYRVPGYTKSNFDLTYVLPSQNWTVSAYVNNVENRTIRNRVFSSGGKVFSNYDMPRTWGVRLSYKY